MVVTWDDKGYTRTDTISDYTLASEETIYLAGFFDGEGSVGLYHSRKKQLWRPGVTITQNASPHVARLFRRWSRVFGGFVSTTTGGKVTKFEVHRRASLMAFIQSVGPYCAGKKHQLVVLEQWLATGTYSYRTTQILKALKRK